MKKQICGKRVLSFILDKIRTIGKKINVEFQECVFFRYRGPTSDEPDLKKSDR